MQSRMETRSSDLNEKQINPICALFSLHLPKKSTEESGKVLQSLRSFTVGSCSEENERLTRARESSEAVSLIPHNIKHLL